MQQHNGTGWNIISYPVPHVAVQAAHRPLETPVAPSRRLGVGTAEHED